MKVYAFIGLDAVTHITHGHRRAGLTEDDIACAREYADNSREVLARYDRKQRGSKK
jgi:hypothetical protein